MQLFRKQTNLFSPEHWQAVYAAAAKNAARGTSARRYQRGLAAFGAGELDKAKREWELLVSHDPGSCDGYHGLLSIARIQGSPTEDLWRATALTAQRFGSERGPLQLFDRRERPSVNWSPLGSTGRPAESGDQLVAGYISLLVSMERLDEAESWLDRLPNGSHERQMCSAQISYRRGDWHRTVSLLQHDVIAIEDPETKLLLADCYRELQLDTLVEQTLRQLIDQPQDHLLSDVYRLEAQYRLGLFLIDRGREAEGRVELERLYGEAAGYKNVAELLTVTADADAAPSRAERVLAELESQFGDIKLPDWPDE